MNSAVDITGLDRAQLLLALLTHAGACRSDILRLSTKDTQKIIDERGLSFDSLLGVALKIDLEPDLVNPTLYDREHGFNQVKRVVQRLKRKRPAEEEPLREETVKVQKQEKSKEENFWEKLRAYRKLWKHPERRQSKDHLDRAYHQAVTAAQGDRELLAQVFNTAIGCSMQ